MVGSSPLRRGGVLATGLAAAALLFAALPAVSASAATGTGVVTGKLVDSSGAPAVGASVIVATGQDEPGGTTDTETSDAAGMYTASNLPAGTYDVTVGGGATFGVNDLGNFDVSDGATTIVPTTTLVRLSTVSGTLVSAADGSPIVGATISAAHGSAVASNVLGTTAADGSFSITQVTPGLVTLNSRASGYLPATSDAFAVGEGENVTAPALRATPAGYVTATLKGKSGKAIDPARQRVVVDGSPQAGASILTLAPGAHQLRYEVSNPLNKTVRHVTKNVTVAAGETTKLGTITFKADAMTRAKVLPASYRRGHAVVVKVLLPRYTDNAVPKLATTLVVNGKKVAGSKKHIAYGTGTPPAKQLRITIPAKNTDVKKLRVKVILHGAKAYAAATTKIVKLNKK